ncbi:hypothetical protein [Acinetobacter baumannii]|uniref:hypothetical protein n=1 Tax=Acinetobacter baumannii TaxID=470 RepID=UPI00387DC54A
MSLMINQMNNTKKNILWRLGYLLIVLITGYLVFFVFNTQIDAFVFELQNKIFGVDHPKKSISVNNFLLFESFFDLVNIYFIPIAVKMLLIQIAVLIWWEIGAFIGVVERVNDKFSAKVEDEPKESKRQDKTDQFTANDLFWAISLAPLGVSLIAWIFILVWMFIDNLS